MSSRMLYKENRDKHTNFYFLARNFRAQINFETISLLFMIRKILNSFRIVQKFNTIFMILDNASQMVFTCMFGLIVLSAFLVPFAQSIWGHSVFGYKTNFHCLNSLIMLNYSKGNLEVIMQHNTFWAFLFIVMYYFIFVFFMHSAFHYLQQDATKSVSLQTGFTADLLEKNEKMKREAIDKKKAEKMNEREKLKKLKARQKELFDRMIVIVRWVFGWAPPVTKKWISSLQEFYHD